MIRVKYSNAIIPAVLALNLLPNTHGHSSPKHSTVCSRTADFACISKYILPYVS